MPLFKFRDKSHKFAKPTTGGFQEWPLGQWLMRPSRNEKKEAITLNAFLMNLFSTVK